jgi:hypothetical protein
MLYSMRGKIRDGGAVVVFMLVGKADHRCMCHSACALICCPEHMHPTIQVDLQTSRGRLDSSKLFTHNKQSATFAAPGHTCMFQCFGPPTQNAAH